MAVAGKLLPLVTVRGGEQQLDDTKLIHATAVITDGTLLRDQHLAQVLRQSKRVGPWCS